MNDEISRPGAEENNPLFVFISYRRRSSSFAAQALRYALMGAGHDVFLDIGSIGDGDAYREVIRAGLARSDLVLRMIWSSQTWGRRGSSDASQQAGRDLLLHPAVKDGGPPVVVYAARTAVRQRDELVQLGAFGISASREELFEHVLQALGRPSTGGTP